MIISDPTCAAAGATRLLAGSLHPKRIAIAFGNKPLKIGRPETAEWMTIFAIWKGQHVMMPWRQDVHVYPEQVSQAQAAQQQLQQLRLQRAQDPLSGSPRQDSP